jgi:hypothetical protein
MYPTVFVLQGLWWLVVAADLVIDEATAEIQAFVDSATPELLFQKDAWRNVPGIALIKPNFDVLPVRAAYKDGADYQIGLNHLRSDVVAYSVADLLTSKLLTGKTPQIIKAYRLRPNGLQPTLRPMRLRGDVYVDPRIRDFFKAVIEARKAVKDRVPYTDMDKALQQFLKILANSTSYGIFGEFNELVFSNPVDLAVFGADEARTKATWFERSGKYCNPYIAACVTGAARLILALMESELHARGTTYAMCDTDAMAVVDPDGSIGDALVAQFASLNPYDFDGSVLKVEAENYAPGTERRHPLHILSLASKRYVLFNRDADSGKPIIRKALEHGLGHLLPPSGETRQSWIEAFWHLAIARYDGRQCEEPEWFSQLAMAQLSVSTPHLLRAFPKNANAIERSAIAPFNFMLVAYAQGDRSGHCQKHQTASIGCLDPGPCRFRDQCLLRIPVRPITKYTKHRANPEAFPWWDAHTGKRIAVQSSRAYSGEAGIVSLKTFGDVFEDFITHAEIKAADATGPQATADSAGELKRLWIEAVSRRFIGKEARSLEINQVLGIASGAYREYDLGWSALKTRLAPFPRLQIAQVSGLARSQVYQLLDGTAEPQEATYALLLQTADALERWPLVDRLEGV